MNDPIRRLPTSYERETGYGFGPPTQRQREYRAWAMFLWGLFVGVMGTVFVIWFTFR